MSDAEYKAKEAALHLYEELMAFGCNVHTIERVLVDYEKRIAQIETQAEKDAIAIKEALNNLHTTALCLKDADSQIEHLKSERDSLIASRIAYASEFEPDGNGNPDVGNIHENIRRLKSDRDSIAAEAVEEATMEFPLTVKSWNPLVVKKWLYEYAQSLKPATKGDDRS